MPLLQIDLIEGRTEDQKRALVKNLANAVVESLNVPLETVMVVMRDQPRCNLARGGVLLSDLLQNKK